MERNSANIPCRFYIRDGFCAKERPVCKFYVSSEGCRRGDSCTFSHKIAKDNKKPKPQQEVKIQKPSSAMNEQPPPQIPTFKAPAEGHSLDQLWGFETQDDHYFYGTAGAMTPQPTSRQYADVLGKCNGFEDDDNNNQETIKSTTKVENGPVVCPFYIYGSCVYGNNCRNIHNLDGTLEKNEYDEFLMNEEITAARSAECGICLSLIEEKSLGMLSNCWCTFCVDCIRSWRKEGTAISKSSHVRLCPLCRTESYFIIPCNRLVKDVNRKIQLVEEYKRSLSRIPCKHYQTNTCPFGISCFYKHISRDGIIEITAPPRILITADETVSMPSSTMLADYVTTSTI